MHRLRARKRLSRWFSTIHQTQKYRHRLHRYIIALRLLWAFFCHIRGSHHLIQQTKTSWASRMSVVQSRSNIQKAQTIELLPNSNEKLRNCCKMSARQRMDQPIRSLIRISCLSRTLKVWNSLTQSQRQHEFMSIFKLAKPWTIVTNQTFAICYQMSTTCNSWEAKKHTTCMARDKVRLSHKQRLQTKVCKLPNQ